MAEQDPVEAFLEGPRLPAEFHANPFKLRVLGVMAAGAAALLVWMALQPVQEGVEIDAWYLWLMAAIFAGAGWGFWSSGGDRRPLLEVREEGLRDRLFGDIPWSDVKSWKLHGSLFNPGFGYTLKSGVRPPRNASLYRWQGLMNRASGLPARTFRKQMIVGGCDGMAMAYRKAAPELEAR